MGAGFALGLASAGSGCKPEDKKAERQSARSGGFCPTARLTLAISLSLPAGARANANAESTSTSGPTKSRYARDALPI